MNITKDDMHLRNYELKQGLAATWGWNCEFYKISKNDWQCSHCLKEYDHKPTQCKCGNKPLKYFTPRKSSHEHQSFFEVFRKRKEKIIKLTFCVTTIKHGRELHQYIDLVRKIELSDDIDWLVLSGLHYSQDWCGSGKMTFYRSGTWGRPNQWEKNSFKSQKVQFWFKYQVNDEFLYDYNKLSHMTPYEIDKKSLEDISKIIKYNKELKFLKKKFPKLNFFNDIKYVVRYQETFRKYADYFVRFKAFDGKTLQRLSWYHEKILYREFEKMMLASNQFFLKTEVKTYSLLKKHLKVIVPSKYGGFRKSDYFDYLRLLEDFDYELTEDLIFNKNWRTLKSELLARMKYEKEKIKEKRFYNRIKNYSNYQKDGIHVVVPGSIKDLFVESEVLHHCVKSYVDDIVRGDTMVLFIRTNPEEPFLTAEVRNKKIIQVRGKHNSTEMVEDKHKEVLRHYIKEYMKEEVMA